MSDELPFMRRLRAFGLLGGIGVYDADQLLEDVRFILVEVDWLRHERDRLHQELERLGEELDDLRATSAAPQEATPAK